MVIVQQLYEGRDGVVRAVKDVKIHSGKSSLERPIQHPCPLELSYDQRDAGLAQLNVHARVFRPRRDAAVAAGIRSSE